MHRILHSEGGVIMPWQSLEGVPSSVKTHKGATLTLVQANEWAKIFDAIKANPGLEEPAAVAWNTWEKVYQKEGEQWVKRERASAEGMTIEIPVGKVKQLVESESDGLPREAIVTVIAAGPTKTKGRYYDEQALVEFANTKQLDGLKQYDQHVPGADGSIALAISDRSVSDFWSYLKESWWDPVEKAIVARVKLCDRAFKEKMRDAWEELGISLTALGETYIGKDGLEHVKKITKAISADWVPEPNAGGRVLQLVEAVAPGNFEGKGVNNNMAIEMKDLTLEQLQAERPDLVEQIAKDAMEKAKAEAEEETKKAKAEAEQAAGKLKDAEKEVETVKAESADLKAKLDDKAKVLTESQAKFHNAELKEKMFAKVDSAEGLTPLGKMHVLKEMKDKTFADEKAMAEAVDAAIGQFKKLSSAGAGGDNGDDGKGKPDPQLEPDSKAFAESIGVDEEEQKRLAAIE